MRFLRGSDGQVEFAHAPTLTPAPAPTSTLSGTARWKATPVKLRLPYVSVAAKFTMAMTFTLGWVALSVWISSAWVDELDALTGPVLAWTIVVLVAYLPGAIVAFLAVSLVLDRQPPLHMESPTTPLTVIIAARNEERGIGETIVAISRTDYAGPVTIILADNGSTDGTCDVARETAADLDVSLQIISELTPGKSNALNTALEHVETPYVVTVDADTILHLESLRRLVSRLESAPSDTAAVAGTVLVGNSRVNLLTKMQEWDYYLGIAAVKRMQGLYQATLVAQGAFSLYLTAEVRRVGGWPDAIGEDIVVTWRLMENGDRVLFEPTAVAFTDAPVRLRHFMRQRARWARGMLEGISAVPPGRQSRPLTRFIAGLDLLIPRGLRADLAARAGPVLLRVSGDRLGVDARGPADHPLGIRRAAYVSVPARLRFAEPGGAPEPVRLRRLPARIPGPVLAGIPCRIRTTPRWGATAMELNTMMPPW